MERRGDGEMGRMGDWRLWRGRILKLRITNYKLRNGELGEATGRLGDRVSRNLAASREEEKGEWVILKLRIMI